MRSLIYTNHYECSIIRFRSLFEHSLEAILLTKPDGSVLTANPAAEKMFGMTEQEIIKTGL